MKISAYSYVRNGLQLKYPFIQSILSVLPIVDEFVMILGDSTDGSREEILKIQSPKIKIVDSIWDMNLRVGGKIFAQQSNLGLDAVSGDWIIHIQADEVIHEGDIYKLKNYIHSYDKFDDVEALLFPFLNFRGDYNHIQTGRRVHRNEIRAFRNNPLIRAYKDSQGFRKFSSLENYEGGEKGQKLNVVKIDVPIFHYNCVRPPKLMQKKALYFSSFYNNNVAEAEEKSSSFDYNVVDKLETFNGSHPAVMKEIIENKDWDFKYDPSKSNMSLRHKILNKIEDWTGYRIGEYKNYKIHKIK